MVATTVILRERIADRLRISSVDMTLQAADAAKIDNGIADVTTMLRETGSIWWADNAIPDACVWPMTLVCSAALAGAFGKAGQGYEGDTPQGMLLLAEMKPSADISTVRASYF